MQRTFEQLIREARSILLRDDEKSRLRSGVEAFMQSHPVRAGTVARHLSRTAPSLTLKEFAAALYAAAMKPMPAILIIALLVVSGSASVAAEGALPGEFLYPVKTGVNEEVRGWFAVSSEAQALWDVARVERRLEEAELLAVQNKLEGEVRADIESRFMAQTDRARLHAEEFESRGNAKAAAEVHSDLEASLRAHARILEKLAEEADGEEDDAKLATFATSVRNAAAAATQSRGELETHMRREQIPDAKAAAEGVRKAAENKISQARKIFERRQASLGAEVAAEGQARLALADKTVSEGDARLAAEDYGHAFVFFKKASRIAQETTLLIRAGERLRLDLSLGPDTAEDGDDDDGEEPGKEDRNRPGEAEDGGSEPSETPKPHSSPSGNRKDTEQPNGLKKKDNAKIRIEAETAVELETGLEIDEKSLDADVSSSLGEIEKELGLY